VGHHPLALGDRVDVLTDIALARHLDGCRAGLVDRLDQGRVGAQSGGTGCVGRRSHSPILTHRGGGEGTVAAVRQD
jgi:hypothetical protein